ncbi:MAG: hypothetical protein P4L84_18700 [Isosphaeraceae bacterium]|nr:hypothetical protein [Isosphaeraceae bacterium]
MRRDLSIRDRLALIVGVAGLWAGAMLAVTPGATGQEAQDEKKAPQAEAKGDEPAPATKSAAPVVPFGFSKAPETPLELWEAADYLIRTGQGAQAVPYLSTFLKSKPDDATLLRIRDRYGAGSILRLDDDPRTRPLAKPVVDMLNSAVLRHATRPERIGRFITGLTKSREEQQYAVDRLRESGPFAVPHLVRELQRPALSADDRAALVHGAGRLDRTAGPPLIATLDSPDGRLVRDAIEALAMMGELRAIPQLTYLAARGNQTAATAIEALTGRPWGGVERSPARVLTDEALRYHLHEIRFPGDTFFLWVWDDAQKVPASREVSRADAEAYFGLKYAREALVLDPSNRTAQVALLSLALEQAVERAGYASYPANDTTGSFAAATAAGPEILATIVRDALARGKYDLAAAAVTALGQVADVNALAADRRPNPLVQALSAPSRRVQFAAARALVLLAPRRPFAGSSRVVPILARFATNQAVPRAVVIDGNPTRGGQLKGFLKALGYDPILALTGDEGFRVASETADVELILIDNHLVQGAWRLVDTLSNLRADARTAGVPIAIVGPLNLEYKLGYLSETFPGVKLLVQPTSAEALERQLGGRPAQLPDAERAGYARAATSLLALVAQQAGSPFEVDLTAAEPSLTVALNVPATGVSASAALADVPNPGAQRGLADVLLDPGKPDELRLTTAAQLARSIQRYGPLVAADQEAKLLAAFDQAVDPALRGALGAVIGALRPKAAPTGARLQQYQSSLTNTDNPPAQPSPASKPTSSPPASPDAAAPAPEAKP